MQFSVWSQHRWMMDLENVFHPAEQQQSLSPRSLQPLTLLSMAVTLIAPLTSDEQNYAMLLPVVPGVFHSVYCLQGYPSCTMEQFPSLS